MANEIKNSKREKITVTRRFGSDTDKSKIFVSTVILKDGVKKLETFYVPVDSEVSVPVEIIECIKNRKVPSEVGGTLKMVAEFSIEKA